MRKKVRYIIPPSFYKRVAPAVVVGDQKLKDKKEPAVKKIEIPSNKLKTKETPEAAAVVTSPKLSGVKKRRSSSALSLNSLKREKEQTIKKKKVDFSNMPKEVFTKADFEVHWNKYIDILNRQGEKMLASILKTAKPILQETTIQLTYPNAMMVEELNKKKSAVLNYLREKLQNYQISFDLITDEKEEKNYAYTPQEKYVKLREINPLIEDMRKVLLLDI